MTGGSQKQKNKQLREAARKRKWNHQKWLPYEIMWRGGAEIPPTYTSHIMVRSYTRGRHHPILTVLVPLFVSSHGHYALPMPHK